MIYGYCRISTPKQSMERQVRNIKALYPDAVIIQETYTGTKMDRPKWIALHKNLQEGDKLVLDSVSRMSRDAESGWQVYQELFNRGVELEFLKEHHIDTQTYKVALTRQIPLTGQKEDILLKAINQYLMELAREQIRLAFQQSEKEVVDLRQRTREGLITAKLKGKKVGGVKGTKLNVKKAINAKEQIRKRSVSFGGELTDADLIKILQISRNSFYKYKQEIRLDVEEGNAVG